MGKKVFIFFVTTSVLILGVLCGVYFLSSHRESVQKIPVLKDAFPLEEIKNEVDNSSNKTDSTDTKTEEDLQEDKTEEASYKEDVYSVHVCDKYTDGSFAVRNIRLGMTFRQVVDTELKNIGVYVENDAYKKGTFATMSSEDGQGQDLLPVLERAVLGNVCEIIYDFTADVSVEEGEKVPYLEKVQYQFIGQDNVDKERQVEKAFEDCFGEAEKFTKNGYYQVNFETEKERLSIYYSYEEKKEIYSLKYIIWEQKLS